MDKQIIIDGVDVSGCEYHSLNKNNCSLCSLSNNLICSYKPFCYYKQLKRKEQECEELKEQNNQFDNGINEQFSKIVELEGRNNLLKQILTEIKEIARKNYKTEEELFKIRHSRLPKFSMGALNGRHNLASEILQKISEVIE